jgi:hypothetical protein
MKEKLVTVKLLANKSFALLGEPVSTSACM